MAGAYRGEITIESGQKEHGRLLDAFLNGKTVNLKCDHYDGPIKVVEIQNSVEGAKIITTFTVWSDN